MIVKYQLILAIGSGGFLGAISRVYATNFINTAFISAISLGTLAVNLLGSFIIGVLYLYLSEYELARAFIIAGFLGAFTTYSTFALETYLLLDSSQIGYGILNILANSIGSIVFVVLGFYFARLLIA